MEIRASSAIFGNDAEATLARLRALRHELIEPVIATHRGRVAKWTGDGVLIEFASVVDALRCAIEVQRGTAAHSPARHGGAAPTTSGSRRCDGRRASWWMMSRPTLSGV